MGIDRPFHEIPQQRCIGVFGPILSNFSIKTPKILPFLPAFPQFPPFFLVTKRRKMGIARPSHDVPQQRVHFGGFCHKNFPSKLKKIPTFPHVAPFFLIRHIVKIRSQLGSGNRIFLALGLVRAASTQHLGCAAPRGNVGPHLHQQSPVPELAFCTELHQPDCRLGHCVRKTANLQRKENRHLICQFQHESVAASGGIAGVRMVAEAQDSCTKTGTGIELRSSSC